MHINNIAAVIRPRSGLEAVDLGFAMAAKWRGILYGAWALTVLPVCLLILLLAPNAGWAFFLIWWLKPLFDRVALFVLGRALFGAPPTVLEVCKELPKLWSRKLFGALILYRLSPRRSLTLPIWELEGLRGTKAMARMKVICQRTGQQANQLTGACILFEIALVLSIAVLALVFLPSGLAPDLQLIFSDLENGLFPRGLGLPFVFFYAIAMTIIEPLFVAAGFALYLNRRTFLEGWDIELAFRRLAQRLTSAAERSFGLLLIGLSLVVLANNMGAAQGVGGEQDPKAVIEEILAHEDFEHTYARVSASNPFEDSEGNSDGGFDLSWLAGAIRLISWVVVVVVFVTILYFVLRSAGGLNLRGIKGSERVAPTTAFGLDIRPESLPSDVAGEALRLWRAGQTKEALSLLYRGSIAVLVDRDGLIIEGSDTERDCLRRVESLTDEAKSGYFRSLTRVWQVCAYGRALGDDEPLESLCSHWSRHFGGVQ